MRISSAIQQVKETKSLNAAKKGTNNNANNNAAVAPVTKETISQSFDNGTISSIGDAGEGSGNSNAVSLFSLSNNINAALESYGVQKAEAGSKEEINHV